jgi:hypothetical protein
VGAAATAVSSVISKELIEAVRSWFDDPHGWCYTASEALYYLAGGKEAGLKPMRATVMVDGVKVSHWWLSDNGEIVDVTADQFDFPFPYETGKGCGFQTNMKGDTRELIEWTESRLPGKVPA